MGSRQFYRVSILSVVIFFLSSFNVMAFSCSLQMLARIPAFQTRATKYVTLRPRRGGASLRPSLLTSLFAEIQEEIEPGIVEGTSLRIMKYPAPSLRAPNQEVTADELKDGSVAQLAKEMFLVMYAAQGVGLAAPQVGVNKRLMVFNESGDRKKWLDEVIMVNPKIVDRSDTTEVGVEGCLSFPNMNGDVERAKWVKVEALNTRGKRITKKFTGWTARVFQHEYDHLDGVVYVDRLGDEDRAKVQPRLDELIKEFGEGGAL